MFQFNITILVYVYIKNYKFEYISNDVQDHLGEVVFVELPEAGKEVKQGSSFGAVESVKATSDVNSPISGEVVEVNTKLTESPGLVISILHNPCFIPTSYLYMKREHIYIYVSTRLLDSLF